MCQYGRKSEASNATRARESVTVGSAYFPGCCFNSCSGTRGPSNRSMMLMTNLRTRSSAVPLLRLFSEEGNKQVLASLRVRVGRRLGLHLEVAHHFQVQRR